MQLVKSDPNQAIKLLNSIASNDTALRSGIMSGLSRSAASKGEFETAWEWSDKIEEPRLRKKVEGKIWSQEQKSIHQQTQSNPTGTLNSLISGESVHAEYWIKDSFDTWSSNFPDDANAWYEENRESLTPSQNQHIARSYATQAIKQGDLETAREWSKQVIDEKFQQAIREKIDAASTE